MWYKHWDTIPPTFKAEYRRCIEAKLNEVVLAAHTKGWPKQSLLGIRRYFDQQVRQQHGMKAVIINGEYLMLYVVGSSWWLDKPYLCEEFLLSLTPGGDFPACLAVIEALAKDEGCGAVCIGTAASPSNEVYARLLNRHGYKTLAYQLVKEIQWAQEK